MPDGYDSSRAVLRLSCTYEYKEVQRIRPEHDLIATPTSASLRQPVILSKQYLLIMPSRIRTSPLWDPESVLKIDNMGRCAGWARTRGRNCANVIAMHNQQNADDLLEAISYEKPDAVALENDLYDLAGFLLCRRWHQDQADDLVEKWSARIERLASARVRSSRTSSSSSRTSEASLRTTSPRSSGPEPRATQSLRPHHLDYIAQLEATIAALTAQVTASTPTTPVAPSALDTPPIPAPTTPQRPAKPTSPPPSRPASSAASPAPKLSPPKTTPSCTTAHVRRRAVDDDCPICHEAFLVDDALVWCKRECGRTVHKTCFADWKNFCRETGRVLTCGVCRSAWGKECGC